MKKKHFNIPIFIPELACPFQCIYCNQCTISGVQHLPDERSIVQTIEQYLATMASNCDIQLAYFGGNFTGLPLDAQDRYLKLVAPYIDSGRISGIRLSTRPDYITDEILLLLKKNKVKVIELGAQSMDDNVLKASKRGHTSADIELASKKIKSHGFLLGLQMMIGLPGDSMEKAKFTAERIVDLGADDTRIYPTLVIKNTVLEKMFLKNEYHPLSLTDAIHWAKEVLLIFEKSGINILKVGLHPSKGLLSGDDLVAGPFHPSFRELVETQIWNDLLATLCNNHGEKIEIFVNNRQLNFAIGYHGQNKKMLLRHYHQVHFHGTTQQSGREFIFASE